MCLRLLVALALIVPSAAALAQTAQAPAQAAPSVPAAPGPDPQGFTYNSEGRRDPFVSLIQRGSAGLSPTIGGGVRPAGLGGLETAEVTLKGTIQSQSGYVGILLGADNKTYIVRAGDRLLDGTVRSITQNALVILQQVNDPLSLEKQREVRKVLRQTDEAK
jgi:Tfp pilus assembly protein PilP